MNSSGGHIKKRLSGSDVRMSVQQPKLQTFIEDDNPRQLSYNSSYSNLNVKKFKAPPKKSLFIGGGFGAGMNQISAYDDHIQEEDYDDAPLERVESFYRNQRLTITNPMHLKQVQQDLGSSFEGLAEELPKKLPQWLAWVIFIYFILNGSMIPPWILSIPAEKYLRIAWRFFMQAMLLIPFVMFEKRQIQKSNKAHQYTWSYILNVNNLKKIYLTSFCNSLWFTMVLFGFEWTYISHSINLASLQLFFLSVKRPKERQHSYEVPGKVMVIVGIILMFLDVATLTKEDANPSAFTYKVTKYLFRDAWQRVIFGNCVALSVSYIMTKFVSANQQTNAAYPPHLRTFIVSLFNVVNMTFASYFFSGTDLFRGSYWGWFGLFTTDQFSGFLYMSILLGLGSFISSIFLGKLFEPIDIQTAQSFEPVISTLLVALVGVQHLPGPLACIGYVFIIPGLFFINIGQHLKTEQENKEKELEFQQKRMSQIVSSKDIQQKISIMRAPSNLFQQDNKQKL